MRGQPNHESRSGHLGLPGGRRRLLTRGESAPRRKPGAGGGEKCTGFFLYIPWGSLKHHHSRVQSLGVFVGRKIGALLQTLRFTWTLSPAWGSHNRYAKRRRKVTGLCEFSPDGCLSCEQRPVGPAEYFPSKGACSVGYAGPSPTEFAHSQF